MILSRLSYGSQDAGGRSSPRAASLFVIEDRTTGFQVSLTELGASVVSVRVPDCRGLPADVAFGHSSSDDALANRGYLGSTIGRCAGRISEGLFGLDGTLYRTTRNEKGLHTLHGGANGFDLQFWHPKRVTVSRRYNMARLIFEWTSETGNEGFPGKLSVRAVYTVRPMQLEWEFLATTDAPTVVNMTNHTYWNLDGLDRLIDDMTLVVHASRFLPNGANGIPTGEVEHLEGSPLDLRSARSFNDVFKCFGDVDNCFLLDGCSSKTTDDTVFLAAEVSSGTTGRRMDVYMSEPSMVVYTGNHMDSLVSFGKPCRNHSAVCLEAQRPPNAINIPQFRDMVVLRPGQRYHQRTIHRFSSARTD